MAMERYIRRDIRELAPYDPPDLEAIAAGAGFPSEQLIRLNANENPFGPSPRVAQALATYAGFARYPVYPALRAALAGYAGVDPEQVVLGNGSNELIDLVMRLCLEPGHGVILCPPTFSMYRFFAFLGHHPVWAVPRGEDFSVDVAAIKALVREGGERRPRLLFLASPGNPDGLAIPRQVVEGLLRLPLVVVVDEAYIEFGGASVLPLLAEQGNLIVLRSFSKWAGLAGLRLGYALLSPRLARYLERIRVPFNVNAAAVLATLATLEDLPAVRANVARLLEERGWLQAALAQIPWLEPAPSQANFILCRVRGHSGGELARALAAQGILVRSFCQAGLEGYVRITVGRPEQNRALQRALLAMPWG